MNLAETLQLLDKLGSVGATHFKSQDFEVCIKADIANVMVKTQPTTNVMQPKPVYNAENTKKMQDLIDLLKSKDEELINKIFPEGA